MSRAVIMPSTERRRVRGDDRFETLSSSRRSSGVSLCSSTQLTPSPSGSLSELVEQQDHEHQEEEEEEEEEEIEQDTNHNMDDFSWIRTYETRERERSAEDEDDPDGIFMNDQEHASSVYMLKKIRALVEKAGKQRAKLDQFTRVYRDMPTIHDFNTKLQDLVDEESLSSLMRSFSTSLNPQVSGLVEVSSASQEVDTFADLMKSHELSELIDEANLYKERAIQRMEKRAQQQDKKHDASLDQHQHHHHHQHQQQQQHQHVSVVERLINILDIDEVSACSLASQVLVSLAPKRLGVCEYLHTIEKSEIDISAFKKTMREEIQPLQLSTEAMKMRTASVRTEILEKMGVNTMEIIENTLSHVKELVEWDPQVMLENAQRAADQVRRSQFMAQALLQGYQGDHAQLMHEVNTMMNSSSSSSSSSSSLSGDSDNVSPPLTLTLNLNPDEGLSRLMNARDSPIHALLQNYHSIMNGGDNRNGNDRYNIHNSNNSRNWNLNNIKVSASTSTPQSNRCRYDAENYLSHTYVPPSPQVVFANMSLRERCEWIQKEVDTISSRFDARLECLNHKIDDMLSQRAEVIKLWKCFSAKIQHTMSSISMKSHTNEFRVEDIKSFIGGHVRNLTKEIHAIEQICHEFRETHRQLLVLMQNLGFDQDV